ncbi:Crp/Fnr family transcriptional regulator [Terriglobus aquaticus]|uniref:Crp/Fnr family transcriptional regulator n=1 Tax=Terriglobus aquaticus TaxID=940139 RepID=A0ABW9KGX6_9BACT|nr:Crp/Fnr family transcriptional regulator [Terriglobus aquaticus]
MAFPHSNLLLASLPADVQAKLSADLEPVLLPVNTVLFEPEQTPRYVHFITSGVASLVTQMAAGEGVEVGLLGREGLLGSLQLLGPHRGSARCFMQIGGSGLRMDFRKFQKAFLENPDLHRLVLQHVQYDGLNLGQLAACNRVHEIEERLARWLLMVEDRLGEPDLPLTQEFLGQMLGAQRSTVTLVAGTLQRDGLIEYHRGHVKIVDRPALENAACECYSITRKLFQNLYQGERGAVPRDGLRTSH